MNKYIVFQPREIFTNLDFKQIKKNIKSMSNQFSDYESLVLIDLKGLSISINSIGKVTIFYNYFNEKKIRTALRSIEEVFKDEVESFEFLN